MANKLELTWYGKDEPIRIEPRLLIENAVLSNTAADPDTENMIIHGDNLLALKALETRFSGQVKCIYIDPPCLILPSKPDLGRILYITDFRGCAAKQRKLRHFRALQEGKFI